MTTAQPGRRALSFVLLAVLIDTIGFGIVMPVLPQFLSELTGKTVSESAQIAGWLIATFAVLQFAASPILGQLSDRFGRRPILLFSMAAFSLNYLLMALAPTLALLFIGRALAGVAGAIYAPANAYIADITPPGERARRFAYVGAAFGFGFILGPALGGLIAAVTQDPRAPFYAAAAMAGLNFAFGWFALPESLPKDRRRPFELKRANPLGTLLALRRHGDMLALIGVIFLWNLSFHVYPATWAFYTNLKFGWAPAMIGASLALTGVGMAAVQGLLVGRMVRNFGERRTAIIGMSVAAVSMASYILIDRSWMVFAISILGALHAVAGPSLNALVSMRTPPDAQGELQGGIASVNGLAAIVGPLVFTQAISAATAPGVAHPFPGAAFALSAAICLGSLCVFLAATRGARAAQTA